MIDTMINQDTVIRTNRGLSIAGTRITLYSIMDYLKADWPIKLIQDLFDLSAEQMADVLAYIEGHSEEVEAEYQLVLEQAEATRQYWTEYNREHLARVAAMPPEPGREKIWANLQAWKAELGME